MKDKYEHEIHDLESSEKGLKQKYIDTRTRLAEIEANAQNLQATVKQMEAQLNHSNKVWSLLKINLNLSYIKFIF